MMNGLSKCNRESQIALISLLKPDTSTKQKGRPQNEELMDFFQNACEW